VTLPLNHRAHLLDFKTLLVAFRTGASLGHLGLRRGRIGHVDVGHACELCSCGGVCGEAVEAMGGGGE
jgi:hypothetical protein